MENEDDAVAGKIGLPVELGESEGYAKIAELARKQLSEIEDAEDVEFDDVVERHFTYLETSLTQAYGLIDLLEAEGRFGRREAAQAKVSIQDGMLKLIALSELAYDGEFDPVAAIERFGEEVKAR